MCLYFRMQEDDILKHSSTIQHTHAKILVGPLELQVSWGDSNGEVVDHWYNLA